MPKCRFHFSLLSSTALIACVTAPLAAAGALSPAYGPLQTHAPQSTNSLASFDGEQIELSADQLTYDSETGEVRALGQVHLQRNGYRLIAGEIRYSEKTGIAEALGAVELITPEGERILSPKLTLSNELKTAFVEDFRLLLTDGSQAAAESGAHDDVAQKTTLNRAVYSPCKVCAGDPGSRPVWQIKAVKVTHDRKKKRIYYENAFLEVLGIPVAWAPRFSHPDPTVEKASGFLPVRVKRRNELGFILSAPYHYVIDDSRDVTITPTITTKEGPVLGGEYRQNLGYGQFEIDGSITYATRLTNAAGAAASDPLLIRQDEDFRGHLTAKGEFRHSDRWRSTVDAAWTSDDTYLRRYDFSDLDTLQSEYQLEGFLGRSYISARTIAFQGLRQEDVAGLTGFALPLIEAEYVSDYNPLGGTIKVKGNFLALHRFEGLDTQRASIAASYDKRLITPKGFVIDNKLLLRGDIYNIEDLDRPDDTAFSGTRRSYERLLAQASSRVSWPLVSGGGAGAPTVEPLGVIIVSPERGSPNNLVNEDSRAFELNALNIFSNDRTAGYDLWEEGSRITYGLNWRYDGGALTTDIFFGQSARLSGNQDSFAEGVGLEGDFSDFVGHAKLTYREWVEVEHRFRLDDTNLDFRRNEMSLRVGPKNWGFKAQYLFLDRDLSIFSPDTFINREDREEIRLNAFYQVDDNWRISGLTIQDLTRGRDTIQYGGEISYKDECIEFGIQVRENFTVDRDFNPGTQVIFQIKLTNLG